MKPSSALGIGLKRAIQLKPSCMDEALKEEKFKPLANDREFKKLP